MPGYVRPHELSFHESLSLVCRAVWSKLNWAGGLGWEMAIRLGGSLSMRTNPVLAKRLRVNDRHLTVFRCVFIANNATAWRPALGDSSAAA